MIPNNDADLIYTEKQRQILLSGHYNSLFNDLELNLPHRFIKYNNPESMNEFFYDLHKKLSDIPNKFHGKDGWVFDDITQIIDPGFQLGDLEQKLLFLIKNCNVPEGHINFGKINSENKIYLSRHGVSLLISKMSEKNNGFEKDIFAKLFISKNSIPSDESKNNFESEMRFVFSEYFFSHPGADTDELIYNTWMMVRGEKLRIHYVNSMKRFRNTALRFIDGPRIKNPNFDHDLEEFKQKFIFDFLFKKKSGETFKDTYECALKQFGYKMNSDIGWTNGKLRAPKYPGAHFTPDLSFFISWTINQFCNFINSEQSRHLIKNKKTWFELIIKNFFRVIKDGIYSKNPSFIYSEKFINQHHYFQAKKTVNQVINGSGKKKFDEEIGKKISETPGTSDFWIYKKLFNNDDEMCLVFRKRAELKLVKLHAEYLLKPSLSLAQEISQTEQNILDENTALYGFNFCAYVNPTVSLNQNGEFVSRNIIGPFNVVAEFNFPLEKQGSLNPKSKQLNMFDSEFTILPSDKIILPHVAPVKKGSFINDKNEMIEYFKIDKNGIYQTVNPLVKNPEILHKDGTPRLVIENFQMRNFLFESDTLSLVEQTAIAKKLVSINAINLVVFSGNKSLHMRVSVRDIPNSVDEYKWLFFHLGMKFGLVKRVWNEKSQKYKYTGDIDLSASNPNRSMRREDKTRIIKETDLNGNFIQKEIIQKLIHRTNDVYDINWRDAYNMEMMKIIEIKNKYNIDYENSFYNTDKNRSIDKFIRFYTHKNDISLDFEQGAGHATGCKIIGAASTAQFSKIEIDNWLRHYCKRYDELIHGWRDLISRVK